MPIVIVRRKRTWWRDIFRNYRIVLDGVESGEVANGKELQISTSAGQHALQIKIDWAGSKKLEFETSPEEQILTFECGPSRNFLILPLHVTIMRFSYLWLRRIS